MTRKKVPLERKLLRQILQGQTDPKRLCKSLRVPLEVIAEQMTTRRIQQLISGLRLLGDSHARLELSRRRIAAVGQLVAMAGGAEVSEPVRKACTELVKSELAAGSVEPPAQPADDASAPKSPGEQVLQEALDHIAARRLSLVAPH